MEKLCILDEAKICNDCGECSRCDLDPEKICDNCISASRAMQTIPRSKLTRYMRRRIRLRNDYAADLPLYPK